MFLGSQQEKLPSQRELRITHNITTCHQCEGSGYDSPDHTALCCSCSGLGKIFVVDEKPVDYITQRELVQHLRDFVRTLEEKKEKK